MADQDNSFKITDRRKFNPDGTPREAEDLEDEARETDSGASMTEPPREQGPNVVSFPSEKTTQTASSADSPVSPTPVDDASSARSAAAQAERDYDQTGGPRPSGLPEASFLGLVNMLGVEAAMHLGLMEAPGEESQPPDLDAARHLIDTLGMLQAKTRGNLTPDEEMLLDSVLADLRMQFVAVSRGR